MKRLFIFLALACIFNSVLAQKEAGYDSFSIGDTVRRLKLSVLSLGTKTFENREIDLEDLRGKIVLIDFDATDCKSCQKSIIHLSQIQKKIGVDNLVTIIVAPEYPDEILREIKHLDIADVYFSNDWNIWNLFLPYSEPHTAVINKDGIIDAITSPDSIDVSSIEKMVNGGRGVFPLITNSTLTDLDRTLQEDKTLFNVSVSGYDSSKTTSTYNVSVPGKVMLKFINQDLISLFTEVYRMPATTWVIDDRKDSIKSAEPPQKEYCVSVTAPEEVSIDDAFRFAQEAVNAAFPYKASRVKRIKKVYSLVYKPSGHRLNFIRPDNPDHGDAGSSLTASGTYIKGKNITIKVLTRYLSDEIGRTEGLIVLDKTNIDQKFDIELHWEKADPVSIKRELNKYGLSLQENEQQVEMLLLNNK